MRKIYCPQHKNVLEPNGGWHSLKAVRRFWVARLSRCAKRGLLIFPVEVLQASLLSAFNCRSKIPTLSGLLTSFGL